MSIDYEIPQNYVDKYCEFTYDNTASQKIKTYFKEFIEICYKDLNRLPHNIKINIKRTPEELIIIRLQYKVEMDLKKQPFKNEISCYEMKYFNKRIKYYEKYKKIYLINSFNNTLDNYIKSHKEIPEQIRIKTNSFNCEKYQYEILTRAEGD